MTIRGVPGTWQTTVTGLLLLAAMVGGRLLQRDRGGDVAIGEAFRDDFAGMTRGRRRADAQRARRRHHRAGAGLRRRQPALRHAAEPRRAGRAERRARHRRGRRDDRHRLALGRHLARLGDRARRRGRGARRPGRRAVCRWRCSPASSPASPSTGSTALIVGRLGLDPLIVTLAAWIWARGLAVSLTDATTIAFDMGFVTLMNTPVAVRLHAGGAPRRPRLPRRLADPARALPLGMRIYAVGGDPRMLRQAGVNERRPAPRDPAGHGPSSPPPA